MLTNVQPTIVNEETPRSDQPKDITTSLKEHQLAMIHEMRELETPGRRDLKQHMKLQLNIHLRLNLMCM